MISVFVVIFIYNLLNEFENGLYGFLERLEAKTENLIDIDYILLCITILLTLYFNNTDTNKTLVYKDKYQLKSKDLKQKMAYVRMLIVPILYYLFTIAFELLRYYDALNIYYIFVLLSLICVIGGSYLEKKIIRNWTEKILLISDGKNDEMLYKNKVVILYDLDKIHYLMLMSSLSCIEEDFIFIDYLDYTNSNQHNKKSIFKSKEVVLYTDLVSFINDNNIIDNLYNLHINLNPNKDTRIVVIDFNDDVINKSLKEDIMFRSWISLCQYRDGMSYIDAFNVTDKESIKNLSIEDRCIRQLRLQINSNDNYLVSSKNYIIFCGLLLFYFYANKAKENNDLPKDNIMQLYGTIENLDSKFKEKMYQSYSLSKNNISVLKMLNDSNPLKIHFETTNEITLGEILYTINFINNKTIGHGALTLDILRNYKDLFELLLEKFDEITDTYNLKLIFKDNSTYISYRNETIKIDKQNNLEPFVIEDYFPMILIDNRIDVKKTHDKKTNRNIVRRNYFEGRDYTPKDYEIYGE